MPYCRCVQHKYKRNSAKSQTQQKRITSFLLAHGCHRSMPRINHKEIWQTQQLLQRQVHIALGTSRKIGSPNRPRKQGVPSENFFFTKKHYASSAMTRRMQNFQVYTPEFHRVSIAQKNIRCRRDTVKTEIPCHAFARFSKHICVSFMNTNLHMEAGLDRSISTRVVW